MILRKGKKKKGSVVAFNRDIAPHDSGVKKSGLAHPNLEQGAASTSKGGRGKKRSKKRS